MLIGVGAGEPTVTTRGHDAWLSKERDGAPQARICPQRPSSSDKKMVVSAGHVSQVIDSVCLEPLATRLSDTRLGLVKILAVTWNLGHSTFANVFHRARSQLL